MMIKTLLIGFLMVFVVTGKAGSIPSGNSFKPPRDFERKLERADLLFRNGNYQAALRMYLDLYNFDSTNCNISYKIGVCLMKTDRDGAEAIGYFVKAARGASGEYSSDDHSEKRAPLTAIRDLADACHLAYRFDEAITYYGRYLETLQKRRDRETIDAIKRKMDICATAKELMAQPADVKIANLGPHINSPHAEYAPRLSADQGTMIFTSRRPENTGGRTYDGGKYFEDIYIAHRKEGVWQKAKNIGWPVNTVANEAAIGISADAQTILIYKDDMGDGNIYVSSLDGDKWSVPKKLNSHINSPHWEPAACLSADGQTIFFVSDRPGGYGGTDLYKSKKDRAGAWGKAENLGPTVNTPFDEHSPYMHPDGVTLFFSSRGHRTMGGYDIFFTQTLPSDEKIWLAPVNVGYPINTTGDDAFYMVSSDKQSAYYSSERADGSGGKDIYRVTFPDVKEPPLAVIKGVVRDSAGFPVGGVKITVTDNQTGDVEGVFTANSKSGEFLFVLTPGKSHNISYEADGRLFHSENKFIPATGNFQEEWMDVVLPGVAVGSRVVLNNIFFDFDDDRVKPYSVPELNRVAEFLRSHPEITVQVTGFADALGADTYNLKLSQRRAASVVEYLVSKGIPGSRLIARGGGTALAGKPGKADPSGRSYDRRVELRIVRMDAPTGKR